MIATLWYMGNLKAVTLVFIFLKARAVIHQTSQIALKNYITYCKLFLQSFFLLPKACYDFKHLWSTLYACCFKII